MESGSVEAQLFDPGPSNPLGLASICVEELHGKFTYTVDLGPSKGASGATSTGDLFTVNEDRLTLLYGNNGTGKTSLLRLLFHALSSAPKRGHRTALLNTRFRRLDIALTDGSLIAYRRAEGQIVRTGAAEIQRPGYEPIVWAFAGNKPWTSHNRG